MKWFMISRIKIQVLNLLLHLNKQVRVFNIVVLCMLNLGTFADLRCFFFLVLH